MDDFDVVLQRWGSTTTPEEFAGPIWSSTLTIWSTASSSLRGCCPMMDDTRTVE